MEPGLSGAGSPIKKSKLHDGLGYGMRFSGARSVAKTSVQSGLIFSKEVRPETLIKDVAPFYKTPLGAAFAGDSRDLLRKVPDASVNVRAALSALDRYGH